MGEWIVDSVMGLQNRGILRVEDGNHGENRPRPDEFVTKGTSFIRAADMANGRVLFDSASKINAVARDRITKGIGRPGDVLISHKGTIGRIARAPADAPDFVCSPQTTFWRSMDENALSQDFLYAYMRSPTFGRDFQVRSGETDMAGYVSLTSQRYLTLSLPPIELQRAISRIIGAIDDKIELNRRMNETLEAMARALFRDWFVDFGPTRAKMEGRAPYLSPDIWSIFPSRLDEEGRPEGWIKDTLGAHLSNFDSRRIPVSGSDRAKRQGPFPYHGATGVMDHVDDYLFDGVYLLVGEDGSVVKETGLAFTQYVWGKIWVNNHAHVLQGKGAVSTEQIYLYFQHEVVTPFVTGAVQLKLSQGRMNAMPFVYAGQKICEAFSATVAPFFAKYRANADESKLLAAMRDLLLPRLMSGEVSIKNAEKLIGEA